MRLMRQVLVLAAVQLGGWAVVASLVSGCFGKTTEMPDETGDPNTPPFVSSLTATPLRIPVGGTANITGRVDDADGDGVSWTLSLESGSTADGTFVPNSAPSRDIASSFRSSRAGVAVIRALPHDGQNFGTAATVTVTVGGEGN